MPDTRVPHERDPHPAVVLATAVVLLAAAGGVLLLVGGQETGKSVINEPASFDAPRQKEVAPRDTNVLTSLPSIFETRDRVGLQGRLVALRGVPVQTVVGDYTFWIGIDTEKRVPVVLLGERTSRQPEGRKVVRAGQQVDVFGVVRLLKDVERIDQTWAIDARERAELEKQPIYISAERVEIVQPGR